jgi:hypothetical protein
MQELQRRLGLEHLRRRAWEKERFHEIPPLDLNKIGVQKPGDPTLTMLFKLLGFGTVYIGVRVLFFIVCTFLLVMFCELGGSGLNEAIKFI